MANFIGYNIRKVRESLKMTQAEVAERVEISLNSYALIEKGKSDPMSTTLVKIAKTFECPIDIIAGEQLPENFNLKDLQAKKDPVADYFANRDQAIFARIADLEHSSELKAKLLLSEQQLKIKDEEIRKLNEKITRITAANPEHKILTLIEQADESFVKTIIDSLEAHVSKLQKKSKKPVTA